MTKPLLVLVTGPPGAGKTTIARQLAPRLKLPLVAKDDIKESLSDSLERTSLAWSKRLGAATFDLIFVLMERSVANGASAMFESNFYPERQRPVFEELMSRHPFVAFEVHCTADPEVLRERVTNRERHPVHHTLGVREPTRWIKDNGPLELDDNVIRLDTSTSEPVDLDGIVQRIKGRTDGF